jgi:Ca2+-binding RTX toxin-like protein
MATKTSTKNKSKLAGTAAADILTVKHDQVTVTGAGGNDTIKITKGNRSNVSGGAGKDIITVSSGKSHTIHGNAANDTITIGKSAGTGIKVYGDTGNDTIKATNSYAVTFYGGDGSDTLTGGKGGDKLYGQAGADKLYGGAGNDTLSGGAGDDKLYGQAGTDTLTGGAGKDTFVYANGGGSDKITDYAAGYDTLQISSGSISKTALANSNKDLVFTIGSGNVILSEAAEKTISLKDSRGSYTVSNTAITLGSDFTGEIDATKYLSTVITIDGRNSVNTVNITGNAQDNVIYASKGGGTYKGGAGKDTIIISGSAKNTVYGDAGDDNINISGGKSNIIYGGAGTDTFNHTSAIATIKDYEAGETLSFANAITGVIVDGQNITLNVGADSNVKVENGLGILTQVTEEGKVKDFQVCVRDGVGVPFAGRNDDDILVVASSSGLICVEGKDGNDKLFGSNSSGITNSLMGQDGDDMIFSGSGDSVNVLSGGNGNDIIFITGGQNNNITGGDGNDNIYIRGGSSVVYGGVNSANYSYTSDNDTFIYSSGTADIMDYETGETLSFTDAITDVTISGTNVTFTVGTSGSLMVKNGVNTLDQVTEVDKKKNFHIVDAGNMDFHGSNADDIIVANSSTGTRTAVYGGAGDDKIFGGTGIDILFGEKGDDYLSGRVGADDVALVGGAGNDVLISGDGNDKLFGGTGADKFIIGAGANEMFAVDGDDYNRFDDNVCDTFVFSSSSTGKNTIYEFSAGTGSNNDVIVFDGVTLNSWESDDGYGNYIFNLSNGGRVRLVNCAGKAIRYMLAEVLS